jgi:uncharacterized protein YecT (DUF1311 family)
MRPIAAALALACAFALHGPSSAFDCAKAATDIERDICASPELKAADDAMSAAYAAALPRLARDQQAQLKSNQRAWLKQRDDYCGYGEPADRTKCLLDKTRERMAFLTGQPETGPGLARTLVPHVLSRPQSKTRCRAEMAVSKFGDAAPGSGEALFDKRMDTLLAGLESDNGTRTAEPGYEYDCEYEGGSTLTYGSPDLIAAHVSYYVYAGGAHGNGNTVGVIVDLKNAREPAYKDIFPAAATARLVAVCAEAIRQEKMARFADPSDPQSEATVTAQVDEDMTTYADTIAEGVQDFANWLVYDDRAEVYFGPYAIGSYAEGEYTCALPKALLQTAAGPNGWLVP